MPIYRSNRPARILSNQEKLDLFRDCTVVHPHLKIIKVMVSEKTARLKRDPNYLPVATVEARAPESGSFDWKVYYQNILASLAESPASDYPIPNRSKVKKSKPYQRSIGSSNNHLSTLREQVIVTTSAFPCVLRRRGVARQYASSRFSCLFD